MIGGCSNTCSSNGTESGADAIMRRRHSGGSMERGQVMLKANDPITAPGLPPIHFLGPSLSAGKLPGVFYFALSAEESLALDPFNQPALRLAEKGIRVFSVTLPAHQGAFPHPHAMKEWLEDVKNGGAMLQSFLHQCTLCLDHLIRNAWLDPHHIGAAGLSRGAFIAFLLAAQCPQIGTILGFAPLTRLDRLDDGTNDPSLASQPFASLSHFSEELGRKRIKVYIGNLDTRVSTQSCFSFIETTAQSSAKHRHRPPPVEMVIYPSIGHKGHGTPKDIFFDGADWLASNVSSLR
jgi:esterase FrsA